MNSLLWIANIVVKRMWTTDFGLFSLMSRPSWKGGKLSGWAKRSRLWCFHTMIKRDEKKSGDFCFLRTSWSSRDVARLSIADASLSPTYLTFAKSLNNNTSQPPNFNNTPFLILCTRQTNNKGSSKHSFQPTCRLFSHALRISRVLSNGVQQ